MKLSLKPLMRMIKPWKKTAIAIAPRVVKGAGLLFLLGFCWAVFAPQTIQYDFGVRQSCRFSPRVLPQISRVESKDPFEVTRPSSMAIGGVVLYANTVCARAIAAPPPEATSIYAERLFGWKLAGHSLRIATGAYPQLALHSEERHTIPPQDTLRIPLSEPDATFAYAVKHKSVTGSCARSTQEVACDLNSLRLSYAKQYELEIVRQFNNKPVAIAAAVPVTTLTPTKIVKTSITSGTTVFKKPRQIVIVTDKQLKSAGEVELTTKQGEKVTRLATKTSVDNRSIKIDLEKQLPRKRDFTLRLRAVAALDGSGLAKDVFELPFKTSGGPQVSDVNIGASDVALHPTIVLGFDQNLKPRQKVSSNVTFKVQGKERDVTVEVRGNQLVIRPLAALPLCASFTIAVDDNVQSEFGVAGDSAWSKTSRTTCYTTFSIGTSVQGRVITAYQFGSGANPIVYIGALHGDELNTNRLMNYWIDELNSNPDRLPKRSLVIIPSASPDGVASGSRFNARVIDLNRNFPASDWKQMVTSPGNSTPRPLGGPRPLSEPESKALASYIQRVRPRMLLTFHSAAAIVEANEAGDSVAVGAAYAARAGYTAIPRSQNNVFEYDTTGALEDWMRTALGWPALLVELRTHNYSEFDQNRDALWYSTGL